MRNISRREVCELLGISRRALQGYNEMGLVKPILREENGYWEYDEASVRRLILVHMFAKAGYKRREIQCTVCGAVLQSEKYTMTDEEKEAAFKDECTTYSYETLARNPDDYVGEKVHFRGEVIQVMESGDDVTLRVNVNYTGYYWTDTIYVEYTRQSSSESRILEDDIIDLYGISAGTITYETVMGNDVTIPGVLALYIDIN